MIPPRSVPGELPQFSLLDPLVFQNLCRDLLQAEGAYRSVEVYGLPGQGQNGVDVIADRRGRRSTVAGQCKRVSQRSFTARFLQKTVTEFMEHQEFWKEQNVDTFILFVTADASHTRIHAEKIVQTRRLAEENIAFELCSVAELTNRLRPHHGLVSTYFSEEWARILCGTGIMTAPSPTLSVNSFLSAQLESVSNQFGSVAEREVDSFREAWRAGRKSEARDGVASYRNPEVWRTLPPTTQASVLRLTTQLVLDDGNLSEARSLVDRAKALDPLKALRTEALVLRAEGKRDLAIESLSTSEEAESIALRASLLVEVGSFDKANALIERIPNSSEGHRLRALVCLVEGEIDSAAAEAERALFLAPQWIANRQVEAMVDYYACIAPHQRMQQLPPWPEPISWNRILSDDGTRQRLARSATEFRKIKDQAQHSEEQRRFLEAWELACLCNDASRRTEANQLCAEILARDPGNYACLVWAIARKLDVDVTDSRNKLIEGTSGNCPIPELVIAMLICHIEAGEFAQARSLLTRAEESFSLRKAQEVWKFWNVQVNALEGGNLALDEVDDDRDTLQAVRLRVQASSSGDWEPLAAFLDEKSKDGDKAATIELCALLASHGRWQDARPLAEILTSEVITTNVVYLICNVLYNCRAFDRCLEVLDAKRNAFPDGKLPCSLLRMRVAMLRERGEVTNAILDARDVLALEPTSVHFLALSELYLETGDFASLSELASRHALYTDLSTDDLLRFAARLAVEKPKLAVEIWERAVSQGLSDEQVVGAIGVGYGLGLETKMKALQERMAAMPENSSLRRLTLEDAREMMLSHQDSVQQAAALYRNGDVCLQMIAPVIGRPLAFWYHRLLEQNRTQDSGKVPVYARSGWRSKESVLHIEEGVRLHADCSALLNAAHFGLLDRIEQVFAPIMLPHNTLKALAALREASKATQPGRKEYLSAARDEINAGRIHVYGVAVKPWASLEPPSPVIESELLLVEYELVWKEKAEETPELDQRRYRSPHEVVHWLLKFGKISREASLQALEAFGLEKDATKNRKMKHGQAIQTSVSILEGFARGGILREVTETFDVLLPNQGDVSGLNAHLLSFEQADEDVGWLTNLIERLNHGLEAGTYNLMPRLAVPPGDSIEGISIELSCLNDLLSYPAAANDIVWVDDRMVNSFIQRDGAKIVDTIDVARSLLRLHQLTKEEWFNLRHRCRLAEIRYLTLESTELVFWLKEAISSTSSFTETLELRTIRQYHARAVADGGGIRIQPTPSGQLLEWPFLLESASAVTEALLAIWQRKRRDPLRETKSEWLVSSLQLPDRGRCGTRFVRSSIADQAMEVVSLANLLATTFPVWSENQGGGKARAEFLAWIYPRVIEPRFEADPTLASETLRTLKEMLLTAFASHLAQEAAYLSKMMKLWFDDLPERLRDILSEDTELLKRFGIVLKPSITIGEFQLDPADFWESARQAQRSGTPTKLGNLLLIASPEAEYLSVEGTEPEHKYIMTDVPIGILGIDEATRVTAAEKLARDLDLPEMESLRFLSKAKNDETLHLMKEVAEERERSAPLFYENLRQKVSANKVTLADLIPKNLQMFTRYLRLNVDGPTPPAFYAGKEDSLAGLSTGLQLHDSFERLATLPVPITETFWGRPDLAQPSDRRRLIKKLLQFRTGAPLRQGHLAALLFKFTEDNRAYERLGRRILTKLAQDEEILSVQAFMKVLSSMEAELSLHPDFRVLNPNVRLLVIWSHSSNVFRVLMSSGVDKTWIKRKFGREIHALPDTFLHRSDSYSLDVAHPSRLGPWRFLAALIYYGSSSGGSLPEAVREVMSRLDPDDAKKSLEFICDTSLRPNSTASFLGEESGWPKLFIGQVGEIVSSTRNASNAVLAAHTLLKGGDTKGWVHLQAVLGESPVPEEAHADLKELILHADFVRLWEVEPIIAPIGLAFATSHAQELGGEAVEHMRAQLLLLADSLPDEAQHSRRDIDDTLLSAAIHLFRTGEQSPDAFGRVAALWKDIMAVRNSARGVCRQLVERLVQALPNEIARVLWPLLIELRQF